MRSIRKLLLKDICVINALCFLAWYKILFLSFLGESYWYFLNGVKEGGSLFRFDIGAEIYFDVVKYIFKDNFYIYETVALLSFLAICTCLYLFIYEITSNRKYSLLSSLIFGVNYTTNINMIASGEYVQIAQRVLFLPIFFLACVLIARYMKNPTIKLFVLSSLLFALSVYLSHYIMFFIPLIIIYMFIDIVKQIRSPKIVFYKSMLFSTVLIISFTILSFDFNNKNSSPIHDSIIRYIVSDRSVILTSFKYQYLALHTIKMSNLKLNNDHTNVFVVFLIVLYGVLIYKIWKNKNISKTLLLTSMLYIPVVFIFNMYLRKEYVQEMEPGNRYLFPAGIGFAIFWGLIMSHYMSVKKIASNLYFILLIYFGIQIILIHRLMNDQQYAHVAMRKSLDAVKNEVNRLPEGSFIIPPEPMGNWASYYANKYLSKLGVTIIPRDSHKIMWDKQVYGEYNPKNVKIFEYNYNDQSVSDKSDEFGNVIIIK